MGQLGAVQELVQSRSGQVWVVRCCPALHGDTPRQRSTGHSRKILLTLPVLVAAIVFGSLVLNNQSTDTVAGESEGPRQPIVEVAAFDPCTQQLNELDGFSNFLSDKDAYRQIAQGEIGGLRSLKVSIDCQGEVQLLDFLFSKTKQGWALSKVAR